MSAFLACNITMLNVAQFEKFADDAAYRAKRIEDFVKEIVERTGSNIIVPDGDVDFAVRAEQLPGIIDELVDIVREMLLGNVFDTCMRELPIEGIYILVAGGDSFGDSPDTTGYETLTTIYDLGLRSLFGMF